MRSLKYNIAESFNIMRWILIIIVLSFVVVVSVYKYIDLSDSLSITYSSIETTYLILNDTINIIYIFMPLYLFAICGLMLDDNFGAIEILKCGSRSKWLFIKILTLLFYTIMYFVVLFFLNFIIINRVFPYSTKWSEDFVKMQVSLGQNLTNFIDSPIKTLGFSLVGTFLLYFMTGIFSVFISLKTNKEFLSLLFSVILGIAVHLIFTYVLSMQKTAYAYMVEVIILTAGICVLYIINYYVVSKKDFATEKRN